MPFFTPRKRFWLLYCIAWLPLLAANVGIILADMDVGLIGAIRRSIGFVVPGAFLGIAIFKIYRRLPRANERPLAFWGAQLALSVVFALVYGLGVVAWRVLDNLLLGGEHQMGLSWLVWFVFCGFMIYGCLAGVGYGLETAERLREEKARAARAEALRTEAELAALRAQLNPHFLFNTLHSLLALVRHDPDRAEEALEQFGDLLRYTLRVQQETVDQVTLAEEWSFVENYLNLERLRLGERLRLETEIAPEALRHLVPVFSLQPLVENAVRYAVAPRAVGGTVCIRAEVVLGELHLAVEDDGPGADPEALDRARGVGLRIVQQRLRVLSNGRGRIDFESRPGEGFTVCMRIPGDDALGGVVTA